MIYGGTTKDVSFVSPVSSRGRKPFYDLPLGVDLRLRQAPGQDPALRMIEGRWNYGREVEFRTAESSAAGSGFFYDSLQANVDHANFTMVFAASGMGADRNVQEVSNMTQGRDMHKVTIPESAEECYDPDIIDRAARSMERAMRRSLAYQYLRFGADVVDLDNVKVFVTGSSLPRIANRRVEVAALGAEFGDQIDGFVEDKPLGPSQDDVDYFVTEVLRRVVKDRSQDIDVDGEKKPYTVGEICSHYDTGAAEAGITAAQDLGLRPVVISTNNAFTEFKEDSIYGLVSQDPAYFRNRAHRGLRHDVSEAMVIGQIDDVDERRDKAEALDPVGLTDRQVLLLYELGLDNNALLDAKALAETNADPDTVEPSAYSSRTDVSASRGLKVCVLFAGSPRRTPPTLTAGANRPCE